MTPKVQQMYSEGIQSCSWSVRSQFLHVNQTGSRCGPWFLVHSGVANHCSTSSAPSPTISFAKALLAPLSDASCVMRLLRLLNERVKLCITVKESRSPLHKRPRSIVRRVYGRSLQLQPIHRARVDFRHKDHKEFSRNSHPEMAGGRPADLSKHGVEGKISK